MTDPLQSRITRHAEVDPAELTAHPENWRQHPPEQVKALEAILDDVGWVQDIIVNERTGHIVDGHLRAQVARDRGETTVPVVYVDLSPEEERLMLAALDPITGMAGADPALLQGLLDEITLPADELTDLLEGIIATAERVPHQTNRDPDAVPDVPEAETEIVPGTIVRMGKHRLICGDSTQPEPYERLTGEVGQLFDMCFTDPPYGVVYTGGSKVRDQIAGDGDLDVCIAAMPLIIEATRAGGASYMCHASMLAAELLTAFKAQFRYAATLIWVKNNSAFGRSDYQWQHEPIAYGWVPGAAHYFTKDRTESTVWEHNRPSRSAEHPTMKPVDLVARAILNSSKRGETVLDPFTGSGSTLIACEQEGRIFGGIELEPRYIRVALERWQQYTGEQAEIEVP